MSPGASAYVALLRKCIAGRDLEAGRRLHSEIIRTGWHTDLFVANLLIQMYGSCRCISSAMDVFRSLRYRNLFTYNITIAALAQNGHFSDARNLFLSSPCRDVVTWNSMLSVSAQRSRIREANEIYNRMPARSVISSNAMIAAFAETGDPLKAELFFRGAMPERDLASWNNLLHAYIVSSAEKDAIQRCRPVFDAMPQWDCVAWSSMIQCYAERRMMREAEELFRQLDHPDLMSMTSMVAGYGSTGKIDQAKHLFSQINQPDTIAWNAMIQALIDNDRIDEAREAFDSMTTTRNLSTWNTMISGYAQLGHLDRAKELFDRTLERNVVTYTAMIHAHGQAGQLREARSILESMPDSNVVSWTTLITAHAQHGSNREAIQLFRAMDLEGFQPTRVTLVSLLVAAAAIQDASIGHYILPDLRHSGFHRDAVVGNSLVHLFGRSGRMDEAGEIFGEIADRSTVSWNIAIAAAGKHARSSLALLESMALDGCCPDPVTLSCVLFAWSHIGSPEMAAECFRTMRRDFGVEPAVEHYVAMVDLLARAGRADEADELVKSMPFEPDDVAMTTLAVARRSGGEVGGAASGAMAVLEMNPSRPTAYVLLCSLSKGGGIRSSYG